MMKNDLDLLSIKECCELLGVSRPTFRKIRKEKKLAEYVVGKRVRFDRREIDEMLGASESSSKSELGKLVLMLTADESVVNDRIIYSGQLNIDIFVVADAYGVSCLLMFLLHYLVDNNLTVQSSYSFGVRSFFLKSGLYNYLLKFGRDRIKIEGSCLHATVESPEIVLAISQLGYSGAATQYARTLRSLLKQQGFSENIGKYIGWVLGELADNCHTHAESCGKCFISAYRTTAGAKRILQFNIVDSGLGIHATLKSNPKYKHLTDEVALLTAFKSRVSSWSDEHNRGKGLTDVMKVMFECNSWFKIESGPYAYEVYCQGNDGYIRPVKPLAELQGTRFSINFIDDTFSEVSKSEVGKFIDREIDRLWVS